MDSKTYPQQEDAINDFLTTFTAKTPNGDVIFPYSTAIREIANRSRISLLVNLDDISSHTPDLASLITANTRRYVALFASVVYKLLPDYRDPHLGPVIKDSLDVYIEHRMLMERRARAAAGTTEEIDPRKSYPPDLMRRYEVYFTPLSTSKALSPREVRAEHIGKLVTVRGIVVRCTEVKPILQVATYTCDVCGSETFQPINGPTFMPVLNCPSEDCLTNRAGGRLCLQTRGSKFAKFQEIRIQEHSDQVPVGHVPRSMTIHLKGEATRKCFPGDHVEITGVFLPMSKAGFRQIVAGLLSDTFLEAHSVLRLNKTEDETLGLSEQLTEDEIKIVAEENFYDKLANSIAPEIFGLEDVKKSLLLLLVGGTEVSPRGMKIRGNINILLMGDPGVAKSQLLTYIDRLAPRSQYTTGRGSSGVGLTAAALKDPVTGEFALEGGALVLADRGVCCIDEFDKMLDFDRTAIHEVMEQQTVSIAKAGIMTTLNARVSILAAANPVYGRYNPRKTIEQNIQLPAALLSRFDLIIMLRDVQNKDTDIKLAEHVAEVHRSGKEPKNENFTPIDMKLIRRYLALCKRKSPTVPERLTELLVNTYVEIRRDARTNRDTTYTSARTLLAILRMGTALARLRLADVVEEPDILEAVRLVEMCKDSLRPDNEQRSRPQKVEDVVYSTVRELLSTEPTADRDVSYEAAFNKVLGRGMTVDDFNHFLNIYSIQGIVMVNRQRTKITFL